MMRRVLAMVGFMLALALAAGPAFAQEDDDRPFDRDCMDDYGRDLCDAVQWTSIVSSFGLEPAEAVAAQGWRGVRVFTVDGYSHDMPMISVLSRGEDAYGTPRESALEVRRPGPGDDNILRRDAWFGLRGDAAELQQLVAKATERQSGAPSVRLAPPQTDGDAEIEEVICLHAWVTVTESLTDAGVVRRIRNACGDDPLFNASFALSANALRGFPHCNHLDPANYRNASTQLSACLILTGSDRVAAAEVLSVVDGSRSDGFAEHLAPEVRWLGPAGAIPSGRSAVEPRLSELFDSAHFVVDDVVGATDEVVVSGTLARYIGDGLRETSAVRQSWRRRGERWMLVELASGPAERVRLNHD